MSTTQNSNNRGQVEIGIEENTISTVPSNAQIVNLEVATGAWYFNVGTDAYLYAASSSYNYLKTDSKKNVGDNGKATISIDGSNGKATVTFQGSNSNKYLKYNSNNSIFSCYGSATSQYSIYLYRYTAETEFDITMGAAGYRTLVSARNVSLPEGLEAYIVTANSNDNVTMNKVNNVKANEPYILKGDAGDYTLTIIEEADEPTGNLLEISDNNTSNGVFVLAKKGKGVGFYRWNGGLMGAGRVYLPATNISNSIEFLGFDEEGTTSISNVNVNHNDNQWYDLSGRRVENPTKGVYIMNGKKVVIK